MGYKKFYPVDKNDPRVWANQIKILMEERGITQQNWQVNRVYLQQQFLNGLGKAKSLKLVLENLALHGFIKLQRLLVFQWTIYWVKKSVKSQMMNKSIQ